MKIYSFGHGAQPFDEFLNKINQAKINIIFDMRERPFSRYYPYFNRKALEKKLGEKYVFAGGFLGGSSNFHNDLLEYMENKGKNLTPENRLSSLIDEKTREKIFSKNMNFSNDEKRKEWITENFLKFYIPPQRRQQAINFLKEKVFTKENEDKIICFLCSEKNYKFCHRYYLLEEDWLKEFPQVKEVFHLGEQLCKTINKEHLLNNY
ncbi:MAG: hypothetical protein CVT88_02525 [Candidatus Altiarchaeales archaeon HGW-Altiarchaeales-1]|nr:MAG: hypothetical protein CVT89_01235 [Candidatus Altiarchaeales archaeon HGW-Altiarchaeales-2]PKP60628.1 MAG: hypothetical protein CVT88_02525 [Candidatus Altiarchaeales archaeon HGW-Altiarchaeales-1]